MTLTILRHGASMRLNPVRKERKDQLRGATATTTRTVFREDGERSACLCRKEAVQTERISARAWHELAI